jgi:glycosyltransferase involved in cell wall biosynthesis
MHAELPLRNLGVQLHFCASRTVVHFLYTLIKAKRLRYDFVLFNGLASLSRRSMFGYPLWRILRMLNAPTLVYWHETDWVLDRHEREDPVSAKRVERVATDESVVHLAVSEACSDSLRRRYPNAKPVVVYNCTVVPARFDLPVSPADPPMVVNLASVQERKGTDLFVETAIKVCRQHATVEFMWLGDGKPFGTWRSEIEAAGLQDRILFPGYVDSAHLLLRRASVLFLSSRDDPFPLSVLEAMCLGRTIVTFDVGGAPEALAGHGTLISPFDTDLAAAAILEHLSRSPDQLVKPDLRKRYLDLYTPEKFALRLNRHLREHVL